MFNSLQLLDALYQRALATNSLRAGLWTDISYRIGAIGADHIGYTLLQQQAGRLDCLLTMLEEELAGQNKKNSSGAPVSFAEDGVLQLSLSWIALAYEPLRGLKQRAEKPQVESALAERLVPFRAAFRELELLRVQALKFEPAQYRNMSKKHPARRLDVIREGDENGVGSPYDPSHSSLWSLPEIRVSDGSFGWTVADLENGSSRMIYRRDVANSLLEGLKDWDVD